MNRPRRALIEDPADESGENNGYVPRRSGGFASPEPEPEPEAEAEAEPDQSPIAAAPAALALSTAPAAPAAPAAPPEPAAPVAPPVPDSQSLSPPRHRLHSRHRIDPIVVDRLIKSYGGAVAVRNLSFTVEPGRVTGFLGPNGAGKTTTLRILVGLVAATVGTATFGGTPYAELSRPQQTVGCVLEASFHPGRSGRNHLRVLAPTAGATDRRVEELLEVVGLADMARRPVGQYSQGMRQRLALAAALLGDPDYLILDEPANGLDPEGIRWLRAFLREFADGGRLVLMSSHQLNEVQATADDIVVINKGRLLAQLPISELSLGEGSIRTRVSDLGIAQRALAGIDAAVEIGHDDQGQYLRVHSHEVAAVGTALFSAGVVVYELVTEKRNLEQEFFAMLEQST